MEDRWSLTKVMAIQEEWDLLEHVRKEFEAKLEVEKEKTALEANQEDVEEE